MQTGLLSVLLRPTPPPLALGLVISALLIVAETLVLYPLEQFAPVDGLMVVYLLGVMVIAGAWGFWLAAATSVVSALAFDYFHTPPLHEFTPAQPQDAMALATFLVVSLATSSLANLARSRAAQAEQRRRAADHAAERARLLAEQQAALRRVATLVAHGVSPSQVFAAVAEEMARCLNAQMSAILHYEHDDTVIVLAAHHEPRRASTSGVGRRLTLDDDNIAALVVRSGQPARIDNLETASGSSAAYLRELNLRSVVGAPIVVEGQVWGLAVVGSSQPEPLPADTEERISDFANLVATSNARQAELIASRSRIVAAADDARRRLERDLHDGAQQQLVSLGLKLHLAEELLLPEQNALKEQLSDVAASLTSVSAELQEISRGIHPAILSEGGLGPALKSLGRRSAVPVSFVVAIERRLPDAIEVAAYYVVAEALTNAAKHARASKVNVHAEISDATLRLSIQDDGIGGADSRRGSGLIGLKDRVEAAGGQMRVTSPPGNGTLLQIAILLHAPDQ